MGIDTELLSQWLNVFSFMAIVPLNILFKIDTKSYEYIPMDIHNLDKDVLINNAYYFVSNFVATMVRSIHLHDGRNTYLYDYVENCRLFCFCGCHGTFAYRYCPGYPYSGL